MHFSNWPRHQLRAQGRHDRLLESTLPAESLEAQEECESSFGKRPRDSVSRATQLLNFLSKSAAQNERALLSPQAVPDFARVRTASGGPDEELHHLLNSTRRPARRPGAPPQMTSASGGERYQCESLLGLLADTLAQQAAAPVPQHSGGNSTLSLTAAIVGDETFVEADRGAYSEGTSELSLSEAYAGCMADLDRWLSTESEAAGTIVVNDLCFAPEPQACDVKGAGVLPAALPAIVPESYLAGDEKECAERNGSELPQSALLNDGLDQGGRTKNSRYKRFLFNKNVRYRPRLFSMANGNRVERFSNGSELIKDAHGRVLEIRTVYGTNIQVHYDAEGKPDSFIRLSPRHEAHSLGERDRHGVVVRDPQGRVRAAGELMAIDPTGCVSVRRRDGQFWSLDLVRGVHIERRSVQDQSGVAIILTALFAADGFRMVTRFQSLDGRSAGKQWLTDAPSGTFRFYGRDGSVVQFESEEDLLELKPSSVWQPGSRVLNRSWKGFHQAGTAWESVQEYITNYLLA